MHVDVFNYRVDTALPDFTKLAVKQVIVNTINPHSWNVAESDPLFKKALQSSDVLLPDGVGIVLAAKVLRGKSIPKIAGADLHLHCLQEAQENGLKVFYLGASQSTLDLIGEKLKSEFPAVRFGSYSPPYKPAFSDEDNNAMIAAVNAFSPDYLFVGMTAPKQEKWVFVHKEKLNARVICSIGAVFDFYAGKIKRPHPFWIKMKMEWLVRFVKEPRRLAQRNLVSMPRFLAKVASEKLKGTGRH